MSGCKMAKSQPRARSGSWYLRPRVSPHGFTLIELLVVISIIALLLSILVPALKMARQQARMVVCISNTRQLNMGLKLYAHDNDDRLPHYTERLANGTEDVSKRWMRVAAKYINLDLEKREGVIFCPSTPYYTDKDDARFGNYGCNNEFINTSTDIYGKPNPHFKTYRIPRPSGRILMLDSGGFVSGEYYLRHPHAGFWYVPGTRPDLDPVSLGISPSLHKDFRVGRHGNKVVLGWADSHVSTIKGEILGDEVMNNNCLWFRPTY